MGFAPAFSTVPDPGLLFCHVCIWGVPMTPDPNTSAKASRYKWEAHHDTKWLCIYVYICVYIYIYCQEEGILLQKHRDKNGRCIPIFSKVSGSRIDLNQ